VKKTIEISTLTDQASRDEAWQWMDQHYPTARVEETDRGLRVTSRHADEIDGCFPPRLRSTAA